MSEPRVWEIAVPWDVQLNSPNRRDHWRGKARLTKRARELARLSWLQAGQPTARGPVRVSVLIRRERRLDQANVWSACKALMDGLFVRALTPDDGERWVRLGEVQQETGQAWRGREAVVFRIEETEG